MTVYAIMKYRLFDIRIAVSNVLNITLLFGLFAWAQLVLFEVLNPLVGHAVSILLSLSVLVLLFFGTPFSRRLRMLVQWTVLQDRYLYQEVLRESTKAIVTILDFDELLDYIADTIRQTFRAGGVGLYLRDAQGGFLLRHGRGGASLAQQSRSLDPTIVDLVRQTGEGVVREELERMLPDESFSELNRSLRDMGAELLIPLRYKGQLEGVLAVGEKGNGDVFLQSDIDLLNALAGHAAVAIVNARLYDDARRARESLTASDAQLAEMAKLKIQKALSQ
jgi:transcriptional regulator with GAF, ATPase, and Fis domain